MNKREQNRVLAKVCTGLSRVCIQLAKEEKNKKNTERLMRDAKIFEAFSRLFKK